MQIEGLQSKSALRRRLKDDIRFRISCGFKVSKSIPSVPTLCRCFNKLSETDALDKIYEQLLKVAKDLDMIDPESIAIDSSKLESYDSPRPNSRIDKSDSNRADWGAKYDSIYLES
jgi:transposase